MPEKLHCVQRFHVPKKLHCVQILHCAQKITCVRNCVIPKIAWDRVVLCPKVIYVWEMHCSWNIACAGNYIIVPENGIVLDNCRSLKRCIYVWNLRMPENCIVSKIAAPEHCIMPETPLFIFHRCHGLKTPSFMTCGHRLMA